jgi:hypothetical protein
LYTPIVVVTAVILGGQLGPASGRLLPQLLLPHLLPVKLGEAPPGPGGGGDSGGGGDGGGDGGGIAPI